MFHKALRISVSLFFALILSLSGFTPAMAAPPANDNFADAQPLTSLPFSAAVDVSEATLEADEPQACNFSPQTVWYSFTPAEDMYIRMGVAGSPINSIVTAYRSDGSGFGDLVFWACAERSHLPPVFPVTGGTTYYFQVGSLFGDSGTVQLDIEAVPPPVNDNFAAAVTIGGLPFNDVIDVGAATLETDEPQQCAGTYKTIWYSFTPAETMMVKADTEGSTWSTNINIYRSTGPAITDLQNETCTRFHSGVFLAEAGVTYILQAGVQDPTPAELHVNLRQVFPPANDDFIDAPVLDLIPPSLEVDLSGAGVEPDEPMGCNSSEHSAWYVITPSETISLRIDTFNSSLFTNVHVYSSNGPGFGGLSLMGCVFWGGSNAFTFQEGQIFYLQVLGDSGILQVNLEQIFPPPNDNFADTVDVDALPFSASVDATDATQETDEPQFCAFMPATVWYSFTPAETVKVRTDTLGSPVDANANVYLSVGDGLADLQFLGCSGFAGATTFLAEAGQTYFFQVGGNGQGSPVQLNLAEVPVISGRLTDALTGIPLPGDADPFGFVQLHRICGENCLEFVNSQQTDGEGRFFFDTYYHGIPLPAGEYAVQGYANLYKVGQFGPFSFNNENLDVGDLPLTPSAVIRGRLVDALSSAPLAGASLTLNRCHDGDCFEFVNNQNSDEHGAFRFDSYYFPEPIIAGIYELLISATGYEPKRVELTIADAEDRDLGDVPVDPVPSIGSISGRVVDFLSGVPLTPFFTPFVELQLCNPDFCSTVTSMEPDSEGRFRFETDLSGLPLPAGQYRVFAYADQYQFVFTEPFEVGEGMHRTVGDVGLQSHPVRFSEVQFCDEIPASGGTCDFSVRISNGTNRVLKGRVWGMADSILPGSLVNFTQFQVDDPQHLKLEPGRSITLHFRLNVPANNSPEASNICTRVLVGEDTFALFNTIGLRHIFCVFRNGSDSQIISPQEGPVDGELTANAAVSLTEVEPNNSCQTAQDVGPIAESTSVDGALDSGETADIDFYRFTGTPGMQMAVDHEGQPTGKGTLGDPLLGFFDSNCSLIAFNDDSSSLNSHLDLTVPEDGVFILAATAFPDFSFTGGGVGSYQLTVTPLVPIGSISGRVVDAVSGVPLAGDAAPFAHVRLLRCSVFGCLDVNFQDAGSDGSFRFENDFTGSPLLSGEYMVIASADQYRFTQTDIFTVASHEDYDAGNLALSSYPLRFSDIQACTVPSQGGLCDFTVKVTNGLATRFTGRAWSIIEGFNLGTFVGYTTFQTDTAREIRLNPGQSMVLRFRFQVRGAVPDGATVCATAFAGQNPGPLFNTVGLRFLFCFEKGSQGFTLMTEPETQELMQHRLIPEGVSVAAGSRPKK